MKKTLAESIRNSLDLLGEASSNLEYALTDLHKESNGQPTKELADEIAADYPGITTSQLMAAYPKWASEQGHKAPQKPVQDPAKSAQAAKYQASKDRESAQKDIEARQQAASDEANALRNRHGPELERTRAAIEEVQAPEGWTLEVKDPDHSTSLTVSDLIFTNQAQNIRIIMHVWLNNKEGYKSKAPEPELPYSVHGDTTYKVGDTWYTFTAYDKHGDSFSIGQYSNWQSLADIPNVLATEAKKAQRSIDAKSTKN